MPRGQFERQPKSVVCLDCGTTFFAKRSDKKRCEECQHAWRLTVWEEADRKRGRITGAGRGAHKGIKTEVTCETCGIRFLAARSDRRFCDGCRKQRRALVANAYEHRHRNACEDCGVPVVRRESRCRSCSRKALNQVGERNPNWKGGKSMNNGYVMVRNNKPGKGSPYQGEHIIVWEQTHGRELPRGWNVHHLNGIKDDNRPENLLGCSASDHHSFGPNLRRIYEARIRELEELAA